LFGRGEAAILDSDHDTGGHFIERFASAFHAQVPLVPAHTRSLRPMPFATAVLGQRMVRGKGGGFSAAGSGGWTASKWFIEDNEAEAEVFFNFDLSAGVREFSE
jgi:hypothetical protein